MVQWELAQDAPGRIGAARHTAGLPAGEPFVIAKKKQAAQ